MELTQINDIPFSSTSFSTTDKTPTLFGKITDALSSGDSSSAPQNDNGPKIASGPKQVEIKIEKKERLTYKLHTLYTINMDNPWYTCDNKEVTDNSKNKCDKYLPFEFTSKIPLELGAYKIRLTGKDKADNASASSAQALLTITTFAQITTPEEKKIIEVETKELKPEEKEKIQEELEITKPTEPNVFEKAGEGISQVSKEVASVVGNIVSTVITGIGSGIALTINTIGNGLAFAGEKIGSGLAFVSNEIGTGYNNLANNSPGVIGDGMKTVSFVIASTSEAISKQYEIATSSVRDGFLAMTKEVFNTIGSGLAFVGNAIGTGYNNLANNAPGVAKNILSIPPVILSAAKDLTRDSIAFGFRMTNAGKHGIANIAFAVGEKTEDVSHGVGTVIIKIGYLFIPEPTKIYDVQVVVLSPTSVKISWHTNHPANGKVNYGFSDGDYAYEAQTDKRTTYREFTLTNLQPDTEYHYEVMSQNKNYVYDANRKFTTPKES